MRPTSPSTLTTSRWWDPVAAFLLLVTLSVAASRLVVTNWTDHLRLVRGLAFLGGAAGLALGQSRFSPRLAAAFAFVYGAFAVPWQLGLTLGGGILWADRLIVFASRLLSAFGQLARREAVQDPVLFLGGMTVLFWTLGVHAGYTLIRHGRPWQAILPSGLTLLVIHLTDLSRVAHAWYLAVYIFLSLLLLGRLAYLRLCARWRQANAHVPALVVLDFAPTILLVTVLLVLIAWAVPALADTLPAARDAWQDATYPLRVRMHERLDDALAALRRAATVVQVADNYGESLSLGRGGELTDVLVMTVQTPARPAAGARYYWRARVYDHYADGRWYSVAFSTTHSVSSPDLIFPELGGRRPVTFTFTPAFPIATLYVAPQPRWVSLPSQADLAFNPDGVADLAALHAATPLEAGETYQARSSLSDVTVAQLRAAADDYPVWVTDRYLEVPSTVTTRTLELARQIAADLDNPYDVAAAATSYLRANIAYTDTIPSPPPGQEPLDWFLFDLRRGFCNYYASAEVILLRSLGIPARLAVGYAQGERQAGSHTYLVRQENAHSWPEVYFPGLGWIEFEPTVSQVPIRRPSGEDQAGGAAASENDTGDEYRDRLEELLALEDQPRSEQPFTITSGRSNSTVILWALVLALLLITLAWRRHRQRGLPPLPVLLEAGLRRFDLQPPASLRRWAIRATLSPLARAYLELNRALSRLGVSPDPADTPTERAMALARLIPAAAEPAQQLLAEYHAAAYGPGSGNLHVARLAARAVRSLSWRARIDRLIFRRVGDAA